MSRSLGGLAAAAWLAVLVWSAFSLRSGAPTMALIGTSLAAAAPLIFVVGIRRWALVSAKDPHPVLVSVISGFGVVLTMVSVNRYGDQFETHVLAAGLSLATWLIWVRWAWRAALDTRR